MFLLLTGIAVLAVIIGLLVSKIISLSKEFAERQNEYKKQKQTAETNGQDKRKERLEKERKKEKQSFVIKIIIIGLVTMAFVALSIGGIYGAISDGVHVSKRKGTPGFSTGPPPPGPYRRSY